MLSELTLSLTGEPLPYATLMYVWCNDCPAESVIVNPRTDRIRKLAVESGADRVGQWLNYRRDIRADFKKVFGEEPGALLGLAIMTDTDNTRSTTRAWYGTNSFGLIAPVRCATAQFGEFPALFAGPDVAYSKTTQLFSPRCFDEEDDPRRRAAQRPDRFFGFGWCDDRWSGAGQAFQMDQCQ